MALHTAGLWTVSPGESKPPAGAVLDPSHSLAQNVLGCWMFNEAAGGQATDVGPYGLHATRFAGTPRFGSRQGINGLNTTSSTDIMLSRGHPAIVPTTRFSVEFRGLFVSGFSAAASPLWLGSSGAFNGVQFRFTSSTNCNFVVGTGGSSPSVSATVDTTKPIHMVGTWGGVGSGEWRVYVNGRLAVSGTPSGVAYGRSDMSFGDGVSAGSSVVGFLDFAVVYNRPLTAAEVSDRYQRPYSIVTLPRAVPRIAGSSPPSASAYGAALFPAVM